MAIWVVPCASQAAATAARDAIDGLLGYPLTNTSGGNGIQVGAATTDHYTYLRKNADTLQYAYVWDATVQTLHGQSYGGTTIDTSGRISVDQHTWNAP